MDSGLGLGLCQPATAIVLVAVAGTLYHMAAGHGAALLWWLMVGVLGGGVFQVLCRGGLEPVAWILMLIPVLIVCFFLAVALFAARMRIQNVREVPCDRCGRPRGSGCGCVPPAKPRCNRSRCNGCPSCLWGGGGPGIDDENAAGGKVVAEGFALSHRLFAGGEGFVGGLGDTARAEPVYRKQGLAGVEPFTDSCPCQSCGCIGGPCPDCGRPGQSMCNQCGGSGCPYCAYAATVAAAGRVPIGTALE
jgi:hypothetical protein